MTILIYMHMSSSWQSAITLAKSGPSLSTTCSSVMMRPANLSSACRTPSSRMLWSYYINVMSCCIRVTMRCIQFIVAAYMSWVAEYMSWHWICRKSGQLHVQHSGTNKRWASHGKSFCTGTSTGTNRGWTRRSWKAQSMKLKIRQESQSTFGTKNILAKAGKTLTQLESHGTDVHIHMHPR